MTVTQLARVCHEVNKAYCESIGDDSQPSWQDAPAWQKQAAIAGVNYFIKNPNAEPNDFRQSWMNLKLADGWKYGEKKDADKKEHPCLVPYNELPQSQRSKDYLFLQVVRSLYFFLD